MSNKVIERPVFFLAKVEHMENAHRQLEINLFGYARLIQMVLPHMRTQNFRKIINITSVGGKIYRPMGGWYHASKFAAEGYSDVLRLEVKPFGIDVVVIEPGALNQNGVVLRSVKRSASRAKVHTAVCLRNT
jgi:NAD(P)-dependent dehydrogenase (short-subunit alcohol dehydrogenase family)